ncbi:LytR/AlgR family response regulator transcription factor [Cohnella lupini]|uniref:LytTR family two component transcriptional regulator n=1 Tax=Cohnella lupini TaxID=1294267 RepID=A0A3D9IPM1_9BACL|nr:LytTR family DNA-binding domain-containing protein [Cohnella lupini]RED63026.1 LytTR family two component transcriptional regulator [Cohnella lupini]
MREFSAIVAEDVNYVRQLIRSYCVNSRIDLIAETGSGQEAILLIKQFEPDIIVLDIELEDMSGIAVAKQLRSELGYYPAIIFATGSTDPLNIMEAVNEIGAFYIVKPIQEERWNIAISKVRDWFEKQEAYNKQLAQSSQLIDIHTSRKSYPIAEETILLIEKESGRKHINVYLTSGDIIESNNTLNQIKKQTSDLMIESIRGFLVNIRHVAGYKRESSSLQTMLRRYTIFFNNSKLTAPLGRLQEKGFSDRLNLHKRGDSEELRSKKSV